MRKDTNSGAVLQALPRWGALAFALMAVAVAGGAWIYLTGDINSAPGVFAYSVADLLFGPVFGAALVTVSAALREHIGRDAPLRMSLASKAALLAAGALVLMACIRAANRGYHLRYPEQSLETNQTVLVAWTTLVAGVNGAAWHFLGWMFVLVGLAGWTSRRLPRPLNALYLIAGAAALFVYQWPAQLEGLAGLLTIVISLWSAFFLWQRSRETAPGK